MDKLKIKWKIFIYLLGFCLLLLTILWMFQTVFLSDSYKLIRKKEIDKAITLVGRHINSPELNDILIELEMTKLITVRATRDFAPPIPPAPGRHERKPESLNKVHEYELEDGTKLSLTFYAMITPVDATVSTLRMQLVIITGIMIMLATVLAIIIAKYISKPIETINHGTKQLAKGNYDIAFCGKGFLEIKELSDTLNIAATELFQGRVSA